MRVPSRLLAVRKHLGEGITKLACLALGECQVNRADGRPVVRPDAQAVKSKTERSPAAPFLEASLVGEIGRRCSVSSASR